MSGKKLFVGNLPWKFNSTDLEDLFSSFGQVLSARIVLDRETNRSRGFGFVELDSSGAADDAIRALNDREVEGRALRISEALEREGGKPRASSSY